MGVSVNSLLDAGLLANGKFLDIYWELNLTGSEIKILRYVFNNCLRLYKDLKYFPKGEDGSPRFWRGKERMADDCGVSYPTFRNSVRHLAELGLVTSMDAEEDIDDLYCIGLSSVFLDKVQKFSQTEKSFRLHNLYNLINLIYDSITLEILNNQKDLNNLPLLFTNVNNKLCETQSLCNYPEQETSAYEEQNQNRQEKTKIFRKAIKVERIPILIIPESIRIQSAKQKLKLLKNVRTPFEKKVLEVVEYYEYKCRQAIHSTGFKALGKDFRNHKNWKFFVSIYEMCKENDWDFRVYIDSQFDRVKYWQRKQLYPYANQFTSDGARKYYQNYIKDYKEKHSITGEVVVKAEKVKSVNQQIIDEVIKDCEGIAEYIEKAKKRKANKDLSPEQIKILYLSDHWMGLSVSYLVSIPWFLAYLEQLPEETFLIDLKQEIQTIKNSNKLFNLTVDIVNKVEKQMGIPATMCM